MADWLLSVGRVSASAADGEEVGDGALTPGVVAGEPSEAVGVASGVKVGVVSGVAVGAALGDAVGVASGVVLGVVCGVAVGVASGVVLGVASGVAVGVVASGVVVGVAWDSGVTVGVGVVKGDAADAGVDCGVAVCSGDGELAGCPPEGAAGCCSHPTTRRLVTATATTKLLFINIPTHELQGYSRLDEKGSALMHYAR